MTKSCYPVALDLEGRRCLVVGGGGLAAEKVEGLLRAGARITVVAPGPIADLVALAQQHEVVLHRRAYDESDLDGIHLAYGADEDRDLNARVARDARVRGILVNAVDDIPNCDFFAVSLVRRGDLQIAISTNGLSPAFARWMREYLDTWLPAEFGDLLGVLADVRRELKAVGPVPPYERWQDAIDERLLSQLRSGETAAARARVLAALSLATDQWEDAPVRAATGVL